MLSTQIRRISQDTVESAASNHVRKLQKPMEKPFLLRRGPCQGRGLDHWLLHARPISAEFTIFDEFPFIARRFGDVELRDGDIRNLLEEPAVFTLGE